MLRSQDFSFPQSSKKSPTYLSRNSLLVIPKRITQSFNLSLKVRHVLWLYGEVRSSCFPIPQPVPQEIWVYRKRGVPFSFQDSVRRKGEHWSTKSVTTHPIEHLECG